MVCCIKLVRSISSGEEENRLLYLQRRLLKSAFSDSSEQCYVQKVLSNVKEVIDRALAM
ncbi:hypothetical protein DPMN_006487 [Dreissena polymorpha]|uniref:Uncharacterized protein n=1 Tax=Dreissena polymorpha TaxID=45954 RepID=A0A9D4MU37_DREPO|nr:hypothetical protein DPMN_006487 [Dreissena polymorpha]